MTDLNFPSFFVPFVGLVFPVIAMASLSLHVKKKTRLFRFGGTKSYQSTLGLGS